MVQCPFTVCCYGPGCDSGNRTGLQQNLYVCYNNMSTLFHQNVMAMQSLLYQPKLSNIARALSWCCDYLHSVPTRPRDLVG